MVGAAVRGRSEPVSGWTYWPAPESEASAAAGYSALAEFVVEEVHLHPDFNIKALHRGVLVEVISIARQLFDVISSKSFPYRFEPWSPVRGQWVKDPVWFAEQSGTCLDFAVTFAAAALAQHVPAVLALTRGRAAHAFVIVDLTRTTPTGLKRGAPMFGGLLGPDRTVIVDVNDGRLDDLVGAISGVAVPLDVVQAASTAETGTQPGFDRAVSETEIRLASADELVLIDVLGLQHDQPAMVRVPFDNRTRPRPAVTTHSPDVDLAGYIPQPEIDRAFADEELPAVVLSGEQGVGKSMAALAGFKGRGFEAGWFLNASDRQTLLTSLAFAETRESQVRDTAISTGEETKWFAGLALQRLASSQPWMVVLDNADAGPADIADLIPRPGAGQRLVVTTTNPAWAEWADNRSGWTFVPVEGIDTTSIGRLGLHHVLVGADGGTGLVRRRGLFVAAFSRLREAARHDQRLAVLADALAPTGAEVDPAAAFLWETVGEALSHVERTVAAAAAWMQPDRLDASALAGATAWTAATAAVPPVTPVAADAAAQRLVEVGVLTRYEPGTYRIHRLIAAAIRATMTSIDTLAIVGTVGYREDAKYRADSATIALLKNLLNGTAGAPGFLRAAHSMIVLLEHRGLAAEARVTAEQMLIAGAGGLVPSGDREVDLALADAHHAVARAINQHPGTTRDDAAAALAAHVDPSMTLRTQHGDEAGESKSTTMRGLLMTKAARPGANLVPDLLAARTILERARDERIGASGRVHEDSARGVFNLGAPNIRLARADKANADGYLAKAKKAYDEAWDIRRALYPTSAHPFRAASDNGWALVDYYRALLTTTDTVEQTALLRTAAGHAANASRTRAALDGVLDGVDAGKSVVLEAKIADTRAALSAAGLARFAVERASGPASLAGLRARAAAARALAVGADEVRREVRGEGWAGIGDSIELGGARCVITSRHGGHSVARRDTTTNRVVADYDSLNLGDHVGDSPATVRRNRQLVCDILGLPSLTIANQTHTNHVAVVDEALAGAGFLSDLDAKTRLGNTDGMVTNVIGVALTILVADCVPVALYDPVSKAIGVAHAGRGGTVTGIVPKVIAAMTREYRTVPANLHVVLGPHIGDDDYEVGEAEVAAFLAVFDGDTSLVTPTTGGKASLHLDKALRLQLSAAGVPTDRVEGTLASINTRKATNRYFSDRAARHDKGLETTGRFALIAWIPR